jgi:Bacterial regulatory helix-turn-helix protein, lysR family
MELHQVRYFLALCKEGSFTRAAKCCGVSQPSLSNAIKKLEQELGGQLFLRTRVNCVLSQLGQEVWPHLARLDQCARDAQRQAAHFLVAPQGSAMAAKQMPSIGRSIMRDSLGFIWRTRDDRRKEHAMRKPIYFVGACSLAAAAIFVWSQRAPDSSRADTASASLLPHQSTTPVMLPPEVDISEMHQNIKGLSEERLNDMTFALSGSD